MGHGQASVFGDLSPDPAGEWQEIGGRATVDEEDQQFFLIAA